MSSYLVTWEIDIEADSFEEAAQEALEIQRDQYSHAVCFDVTQCATKETRFVDLLEIEQ